MKCEEEKVSIIVPIYNGEKYLQYCIESILNQEYYNIEVILLDDGSTDKTSQICDRFATLDSRVRVIHQDNIGVSKTRQKSVSIAKGKYIAFVDADDYIKKDYINRLYTELKENNVDVVCCNSIDINQKIIEKKINVNTNIDSKEIILENYFELKRYPCVIWGKLFNKEILKDVSFPDMKYAEDTYLMMQLLMKECRIRLITYEGYHYRFQEQSASNTIKRLDKFKDLLKRDIMIYDLCKGNFKQFEEQAERKIIESLYGIIISELLLSNISEIKKYKEKYKQIILNFKIKKIKTKIKKKIILYSFKNPYILEKISKKIYKKE